MTNQRISVSTTPRPTPSERLYQRNCQPSHSKASTGEGSSSDENPRATPKTCFAMGLIDHRSARGPQPPVGAEIDRDPYTGSSSTAFRPRSRSPRSRSPSPSSDLIPRMRTRKMGKSNPIAIVQAGIQHTLERRSLDLKIAVLGADNPDVIDFIWDLACSWYDQGLYWEAGDLQVKLVDATKYKLGATNKKTLFAFALYNLAFTWHKQGKYTDSESLLVQIFEGTREQLRHSHIHILDTLAMTWWRQGRYDDAESAQSQVVEIRKESLGPQHYMTTNAILNFATILNAQGRHEEAEAAQIQVLESRREIFGPMGRQTILAMGELARTWYNQGRYEEAEALDSEVLDRRQQVLGSHHPDALHSMHNLAITWHTLKRYDKAESLMSETVELREKAIGRSHPLTISSIDALASWQKQRREREAQVEEDDTLELLNLYSDDAPQTTCNQESDAWITDDEISDSELPQSETDPEDEASSAWITDSGESEDEGERGRRKT